MMIAGALILLLGVTMFTRGLIYTLKPEGKMAEKRRRRNLKVGFTTDMKLFGRKVRRLGFLLSLIGAGLIGWRLSAEPEKEAATTKEAVPAATP